MKLPESVRNQVIFITGASLGIGRETALLLSKKGSKLALTYLHNRRAALEMKNDCLKNGAKEVLLVKLDLGNNDSIKKAAKKVLKHFGSIDILINNAGIIEWNKFSKQSFESIENQVRTNLEGPMKLTLVCLPKIKQQILNVASRASKTPMATMVPYCASKFGVRGFSESLALECPQLKIYTINPGMTATRMHHYHGTSPEKVAQIMVNTIQGKYPKVKSGGDVDVEKLLKK